ncbi:MAG: polysaccharide biosynthesis C-terminal domain-containing protein, partial [Synergistaceae bacterium]|nr:polysaccharide biosynthesis C-terminal domain-containing protein [Synergistaceae bacterium]
MSAPMFQRSGHLLRKRFRGYFAATLLVALSSNLAAAVDQVIVGNMLGAKAMAAVGLTLPFTYGISVIYLLFSIGGSIMAAVAMGRREMRTASAAYSASMWLIVLAGLLVMFSGLRWLDALTGLLAGGDAQLAPMVKSYLRPLLAGVLLLLVVPGCGEFVRLDGHPRLVSVVLVGSNVVNLVCDVIFISLLGDVSGAAWATVVGYLAGFLLLVFYVRSPARTLRLVPPSPALLSR